MIRAQMSFRGALVAAGAVAMLAAGAGDAAARWSYTEERDPGTGAPVVVQAFTAAISPRNAIRVRLGLVCIRREPIPVLLLPSAVKLPADTTVPVRLSLDGGPPRETGWAPLDPIDGVAQAVVVADADWRALGRARRISVGVSETVSSLDMDGFAEATARVHQACPRMTLRP